MIDKTTRENHHVKCFRQAELLDVAEHGCRFAWHTGEHFRRVVDTGDGQAPANKLTCEAACAAPQFKYAQAARARQGKADLGRVPRSTRRLSERRGPCLRRGSSCVMPKVVSGPLICKASCSFGAAAHARHGWNRGRWSVRIGMTGGFESAGVADWPGMRITAHSRRGTRRGRA